VIGINEQDVLFSALKELRIRISMEAAGLQKSKLAIIVRWHQLELHRKVIMSDRLRARQ
jgi:hypothetical protein